MLSFKPAFQSLTFIKKLFSSSLLSAIRVVSSAYLRLLIFLMTLWTVAHQASLSMGFSKQEEERKSLLIKVKEESEKVGLKLKIQKMKIMALGPIPSWKIERETMETER